MKSATPGRRMRATWGWGHSMAIRSSSAAVLRWAALAFSIALFWVRPAHAEMHNVATFGNWETHSILIFADGELQGTRLAAIIIDHPSPPPDTHSGDVPRRIVVVFDKQTWPTFATM